MTQSLLLIIVYEVFTMNDLSHARKRFYIIFVIIIAGVFLSAAPLCLVSIAQVFSQPADDKWNGWDTLAIDYLKQQEEISVRYDEEYTFRCTKLYCGYEQGDPMYALDGTQLPTDVVVTIVVYKGPAIFAFVRDDYKVYFLRNEDGTYHVDKYETKNMIGSLIWNS